MKRLKQFVNDARTAELVLVETSFADLVDGRWVDISTDVRFAAEAEAVTKAVIERDSGQTVGLVKNEKAFETAKIGPVGERGRIQLTYRCEELAAYREMSLE